MNKIQKNSSLDKSFIPTGWEYLNVAIDKAHYMHRYHDSKVGAQYV
ncbi:MAG: hypothetical protein PHY16_10810 [Methylobacter sp.]|nr:hypothetical protein [Methylobacter sp.]